MVSQRHYRVLSMLYGESPLRNQNIVSLVQPFYEAIAITTTSPNLLQLKAPSELNPISVQQNSGVVLR